MIRPLKPSETVDLSWILMNNMWTDFWEEEDCMQEALTAEWLIEYGFMPWPSEVYSRSGTGYRIWPDWFCEDKTADYQNTGGRT